MAFLVVGVGFCWGRPRWLAAWHVAFHDLGMVDVVQDLHVGRADPRADLDAPGHVVEHVALVVDLAVEVLDTDVDLVLLREARDLLEGCDCVFDSNVIGDPVSAHGDAMVVDE